MKIFLLTEEFDRTADTLGCYDSLDKARNAAIGVLEWKPWASAKYGAVQWPIDNIVSVAKQPNGNLYVVREFLLRRWN